MIKYFMIHLGPLSISHFWASAKYASVILGLFNFNYDCDWYRQVIECETI